MLILNRRKIIEEKVNQLKNGYTAFAESQEVIRLLTRAVNKHGIAVYLDHTDSGCWFVPQKNKP